MTGEATMAEIEAMKGLIEEAMTGLREEATVAEEIEAEEGAITSLMSWERLSRIRMPSCRKNLRATLISPTIPFRKAKLLQESKARSK
jgi:hypothetical protein